MFRLRARQSAGMALISFALMAFSVILHPKEQQIEAVQDETRRKKDAQSGELRTRGVKIVVPRLKRH